MPTDLSILLQSRGYRLERELGQGGMGIVYQATQLSLSRSVAIKTLSAAPTDAAALARFRREAQTLREVQHPNVVEILDVSLDTAPAFLVLEYLDSATPLSDVIDSPGSCGNLTARIALVLCILDGLAAIHEQGIVHRDFKPANILLDRNGVPKLIDFGLARMISASETRHTRDGQVLGTLAYMSPEQMRGEDATLRSDVYAAGLVAYELLCGKTVFASNAQASVRVAYIDRLNHGVPDIRRHVPDLDPRAAALVMQCVSEEAAQRPANAQILRAGWPTTPGAAATAPNHASPITHALARPPAAAPRRNTGRTEVLAPAVVVAAPSAERRLPSAATTLFGTIMVALLAMFAAHRRPSGIPTAAVASLAASTAPAEAPSLSLRATDSELQLRISSTSDLEVQVDWLSPAGPRQIRRLGRTVDVSVPLADYADALRVSAAGQSMDLAGALRGRMQSLLQQLRPLELAAVLRRARQSAERAGRKKVTGPETPVLPPGVTRTLVEVGPLVGVWLQAVGAEDYALELRSRLHELEVVDEYLTGHGLAPAARIAALLPVAWAERLLPQEDPRLEHKQLRGFTIPQRKLDALTDGKSPATEFYIRGPDFEWFSLGAGYGIRSGGAPTEITWNQPAWDGRVRTALSISVDLNTDAQCGAFVELNGRLRLPFVRVLKAGTVTTCTRSIPPELLVAGPNRMRVTTIELPDAHGKVSGYLGSITFVARDALKR